jgi:hypothetical protein
MRVFFATPEAHALVGATTDSELQVMLEEAGALPAIKEMLNSRAGEEEEELSLCLSIGKGSHQRTFLFEVHSTTSESAMLIMSPFNQLEAA